MQRGWEIGLGLGRVEDFFEAVSYFTNNKN